MSQNNYSINRRGFLKTSSVATAALAAPFLAFPQKTFAQNSDTLKIGLIGCGGRGSGAANNALNADKNVVLTAMADVYSDRLQSSLANLKAQHPERVKVDPEHCFVGLDAYQKVIDSGVDVVLLTTPPGFRPQHLKAAIAAGKHVFCEKPMAVDGPGVRSILASAEEARKKKLAVVSGFCWRANAGERAIMQLIHEGAIGAPMALQNTYNTGPVWVKPRQPGQSDLDYQLRNWYYFAWLSGDHIVEQAVHSIDKMAWAMQDVPPVQCVASGGRQVRTGPDYGHIYDHFSVVYEYANGARGYHYCRQQAGCAVDNSDYFIGTKGIAKIKAFGTLEITGEKPWRFRGPRPDMYQVEHDELFASIRKGEPINHGVWMAHSTLLAVMGRMAAYTGQVITWDQALNSQETLGPEKLDWNMNLPVPPVAIPGQTKFV
jgi:myo-inositol 2-dehydrogenase / D-chiro-inositol 1-dehydrogenase